MKKFKNWAKAMAVICLVGTVSCSDDDDNNSSNLKTIAETAQANADLSSLVAALYRAGLVSTLDGEGDFTVFAPTNAAFNSFLSANGFPSVDEVPVPVLREVLLNHVIVGSKTASQLSTGYLKTQAKGSASATNTLSMFVNTSGGVTLNGGISNGGATVTTANLKASNGVVHVVNGVIGLPTVVNHAIANPDFSNLVAALTRDDQPDFAGILNGTGPFTVFAPNNAAFGSLLTELSLGGLNDVPQAVLENTLKYHVMTGANVLSNTLTNNQMVSTFQGQNFTVQLPSSGAQILDANDRVSKIIAADVQASNGVIHAIDKVILPAL
jgi:uncharacterized surface protein with fasciclin (FAS1) repeats